MREKKMKQIPKEWLTDAELVRELKKAAINRNLTLKALILGILRDWLHSQKPTSKF